MKTFVVKIFVFLLIFCGLYQINFPIDSPFKIRSMLFALREKGNKSNNINQGIIKNRFNEDVNININNIGFNSHRNYYTDSISKNDYAIIGDSFVDSQIVGFDNSIAFNLETLTNKKVYNFGISAGDLSDYITTYNTFKLDQLKHVFILITGSEDLKNSIKNRTNHSSIKLFNRLDAILNENSENFDEEIFEKFNNVTFIFHNGINSKKFETIRFQNKPIDIDIEEQLTYPDGHYKASGNIKIANKLYAYLNNDEN